MSKSWRSSAIGSSLVALLILGSGSFARAQNAADGLHAREEKTLAQHYYEVGKKLYDDMDYSRAYEELRLAVEHDPTNQQATELYYTCGSIIGKREDELRASLERIHQEHEVKVQLISQEMKRFFESGQKHFDAGEFDAAIADLDRAREMIAWYPYQIDTGNYREKAERLIAEAKKNKKYADLDTKERQEKQAIETARAQEHRQIQEREARIEMMLGQTHDAITARRFKQAKDLALKILDDDPHNPFAKKYLEYALLGIHTVKAEERVEKDKYENWSSDIEVEKAGIPQEGVPEELIRFDPKFPEKTKDRRAGINQDLTDDPFWVKNYKKILRERRVTLNFPDVPLQDVILFLQDITGLNFVIAQGVDATEKRISLRLKDIVLDNALKIILEQTKLIYKFDKESIIIDQPGAATGEVYFDIYDISDILFKVQDFTAHRLTLPNPSAPASAGAGNSLIFDDPSKAQDAGITADNLIEIIKNSTGGDEAWPSEGTSIEGHRGQLLVNNTREMHAKVTDVLNNLRANQGLFVHIETRFVDIDNDMLEDVGVDFRGLGGNPGNSTNNGGDERIDPTTGAARTDSSNPFGTPLSAFGGAIGASPGNTANSGTQDPIANIIAKFGGTDVGVAQNNTQAAARQGGAYPGLDPEPGNNNVVYRTQNIFGSAVGPLVGQRLVGGGGLTLMATALEHFQINAILHAEDQHERIRQVTAPRVTAANRERVYTSVITQRAYISDWQLVSGGTGLTVVEVAKPVIATLQEGVMLEVRPTISADRKFVTLDVRPSISTLVGGNIPFIQVNLGSVTQAAIQVPIQIPEITLDEAFTSITIPDGGTALLGGFRQINQHHESAGIPILMDIPILGFFFKREGEIRETRSLVILITAKIVSIREEEARRFNKSNQ